MPSKVGEAGNCQNHIDLNVTVLICKQKWLLLFSPRYEKDFRNYFRELNYVSIAIIPSFP